MPRHSTIVLATNNAHKLEEMREIFARLLPDVSLVGLADAGGPYPDAPETGDTFAANAEQKARWYAERTKLPTLADDSGICVECLGGRPGIHSARYAETPKARIDKLVAEVAAALNEEERTGDPATDTVDDLNGRDAYFACVMALVDPSTDAPAVFAEGRVNGLILRAERGDGGFGYDPVFFVPEFGCSMAELTAEQKHSISHRGRAAVAMAQLVGGRESSRS